MVTRVANRAPVCAAALWLLIAQLLQAQGAPSGDWPFEDPAAIQAWLENQRVPVLGLGVIRQGRLKELRVCGKLRDGSPAPLDTLFNVASLAKPVTALVTLRLVNQGRWDMDKPLSEHWVDPDLQGDPRLPKLTTRMVLSHRTGFLNWRWQDPSKKLAFTFEPGTRYQYSGEGFEYLRRALERKFGTSLEVLARTLLFEPLRMADTQFVWSSRMEAQHFAVGFDPKGKAYDVYKRTEPNAADDLITTVEDYGRFAVAVMNGALLSPELQREMCKPQVKTKDGKSFGLGWERYELGSGEFALAHGGADEGVQTQVVLFPVSGDGLVIFTNVDDGYKLYEPLLQRFMGERGRKVIEIELAK